MKEEIHRLFGKTVETCHCIRQGYEDEWTREKCDACLWAATHGKLNNGCETRGALLVLADLMEGSG